MVAALVFLFLTIVAGQTDPQHYCQGVPTFQNNARDGYTLEQVQLITRHGDRTPVNFINVALENVVWNCSNYQETFGQSISTRGRLFRKNYMANRELLRGNCLFGQLTDRGAKQHQALGRNVRVNYIDNLQFLPPKFDPSLVGVRSTDVERTLLSAFNLMEGMYPFDSRGDETVDLYTMDIALENMYPNTQLCPAIQRVWNNVSSSQNYTSYYQKSLGALAAKFSALWGIPINVTVMMSINDIVRARYCHGYPMLPGMSLSEAETIMQTVRVLDDMLAAPFAALRLSSGPFLQDILANIGTKRFQLFSGHDDTLRSLLLALHAYDYRWPPYASHVALEYWRQNSNGQIFVVMQFNGQNRQMVPPCKDVFCDFEDFRTLLNSYQIKMSECK